MLETSENKDCNTKLGAAMLCFMFHPSTTLKRKPARLKRNLCSIHQRTTSEALNTSAETIEIKFYAPALYEVYKDIRQTSHFFFTVLTNFDR
jgi:hypothetical protein